MTRQYHPVRPLSPELRLSLRAALCISAPLVIGLVLDQRLYAIVAGIGALWAVSQDGLDSWRVRGPRLLWVAASGGTGVAIGSFSVTHLHASWALVLLVGLVALAAGVIEASQHATAGAYLLIGTIMGVGLQFRGVEWQCTLAIVVGALWVYLVAALMNRLFYQENQRVVLAQAFDALAATVDARATPRFAAVRSSAVRALDHAQDVVGAISLAGSNAEEDALYRCLIVALRAGEAISYLEGKGLAASASVAPALRGVARALRTEDAEAASVLLGPLRETFLDSSTLDATAASALRVDLTVSRPHAVRRFTPRAPLPVGERLRFALILAVAVSVAMIISLVLDGPHGFWLPMAVGFILRPDVGPVITRALARTAGTALGVAIAALVAWTGNTEVELIVLSCVMAAVQPWAQRRSHVLSVMTFTPIVFVFLGLVGSSTNLFGARILDTALGASIVLIVDVALWTTAPSLRPAHQLADARAAAERYERDAPLDDAVRRNQLRRAALRSVANARVALTYARGEPRLLGRFDATSALELTEIERRIDAHTVALLERTD